MDANHREYYNWHGPRCFLQELTGHVQFCMGVYGEESLWSRNFFFCFFFWGGGGGGGWSWSLT